MNLIIVFNKSFIAVFNSFIFVKITAGIPLIDNLWKGIFHYIKV